MLLHRIDQVVALEGGTIVDTAAVQVLDAGLGLRPASGRQRVDDGACRRCTGRARCRRLLLRGGGLLLRRGLGLDGVIGESGDGLVYGSLGLRGDSRSSNTLPASSPIIDAAGGVSAVRSRLGISFRLRMPFCLVPGDPLLTAPLYFFAPQTYANMAVTASNGGLIPWQAGWASRYGRFPVVLWRELGTTFYGYGFDNQTIVEGATPGGDPRIVDFKSLYFDLPVLEYRPYRAFDTRQSSAVMFQLFLGAELPKSNTVAWPVGAPEVRLENIYSIGLHIIFDWRRYLPCDPPGRG